MPSEYMLAKVQAAYTDAARSQPAIHLSQPWRTYPVRSVRPSPAYLRPGNGGPKPGELDPKPAPDVEATRANSHRLVFN
jgi:hypothetical protein